MLQWESEYLNGMDTEMDLFEFNNYLIFDHMIMKNFPETFPE